MNEDYRDHDRRRLLGPTMPEPPRASPRESGLRHVRRVSNWSLAALVLGVGTATAALARTIPVTTTGTVTTASPGSVTGSSTSTNQTSPTLTGPVATTSASGVTTVVASPSGGASSSATASRATGNAGDS